jgi:uncharacterized membrane protein YjdF
MGDKPTVEALAAGLDAHERVCAERYRNIEDRLVSGDKKFDRLEHLIWGLYLILISSTILSELIN